MGNTLLQEAWITQLGIWDSQIGIPVREPFEALSNFVQSMTYSQDDTNSSSWAYRDILPMTRSFWDPDQKDFMSTHQQLATAMHPRQNSHENLNEETINLELTHSNHPLAIPSDGWLRNVDGGLLTYVPYEHWGSICDMSEMCIPDDAQGHPIRLDWDGVYNAWDNIRKMMA